MAETKAVESRVPAKIDRLPIPGNLLGGRRGVAGGSHGGGFTTLLDELIPEDDSGAKANEKAGAK